MSTERRVPLAFPLTGQEELDEIAEVLRSGRLTQGPKVAEFEGAVAERVGVAHAFATSSCTTAMHLSLAAMDIGPGDEVLVPDFTFPATANVVVQQGATPVLVDVELDTYNVDPDELARHLTPRTRAIMPVHLFGLSADMDPVLAFAREHGLRVVEDAACALGSNYRGRACGSMGDVGCFSFHPRKVITTGEGGMVVTDDDELAARIALLRSHGGVRRAGRFTFERAGFNYRLSDVHAAMGVVQMRRLDSLVARRRELATGLRERLAGVPGITPPAVPEWDGHVYQAFVALVDEAVERDAVIAGLRDRGVETTLGTYALHAEPFFAELTGARPGALPASHAAARRTLALPLYPSMGDGELDLVADALGEALAATATAPPSEAPA
jgi:dTDP-4-amino-4,6-dideoxygalactose transaminase